VHPLYNLGIKTFGAAIKIAALHNVKARKIVKGHHSVFTDLEHAMSSKHGQWIWIHAASLGEFEQGRPLIERIRAEHPEKRILLTFFSPSGYEVRRDYPKVDAVTYLPLDTPGNARRFLDIVKPGMAIFIKYEFWGNYLTELQRRHIPTYIISAIFRQGQIFFRPWGKTFRQLLGTFTHLYVQDEASRRRLADIGVNNVTVAGDTRFDRVTDVMKKTLELPAIDNFVSTAHQGCLVAGSTWPDDENILIPWLRRHPDIKAIFAPHEFDRRRLHNLEARLSEIGPTHCLSHLTANDNHAALRFIIIDSFGLLASLYRKASVAYVGGGLGAGIHNINEAAAYAIPVVFGPKHYKFKEAEDIIAIGGGFSFDNADTFDTVMTSLFTDTALRVKAGAAAGKYIADSIGATDRIFSDLFTTPSNHD